VAILSISFVGLLWHVVINIPTTANTATSRTTDRLYYSQQQQQQMNLNIPATFAMLFSSHYHHHNSHSDNLTNNHNRESLLLLRHAKSSWDDPGLLDFDRPLSPKGKQDAENLCRYLNNLLIHAVDNNYSNKQIKKKKHHKHHKHHYHSAEQLLPPGIIYVSPSIRTRATLELVAKHWKALAGIPVHTEQALYDFENDESYTNNNTYSSNTYLDFVQHLDPIYQRVMIVGHNPAMEQLEQQLAEHAAEKYPQGTFCELVFGNISNNDDSNVTAWNALQAGHGQGKVRLFVTPKQTAL
jgi:phosphohistidine phosphatase